MEEITPQTSKSTSGALLVVLLLVVIVAIIGGGVWLAKRNGWFDSLTSTLATPTPTVVRHTNGEIHVPGDEHPLEEEHTPVPSGNWEQVSISKDQLMAANGLNGQPCYVAVDGVVYKIEGFTLWQNGQHTAPGATASCGIDASQVIMASPHGKSKLELLPKVGKLQIS